MKGAWRTQLENINRRRALGIAGLAETASVTGALSELVSTGRYGNLTPEMKDAFRLAFPTARIEDVASCSGDRLEGFLSVWKGKLFELMIVKKLNHGYWIGDIHLEHGQFAELASGLSQPGWDIRILNADGSVAEVIQAKATSSLGYIKEATERYPHIKIVATEGLHHHLVQDSGVSNADLLRDLKRAAGEQAHHWDYAALLTALPFVVIAATEAWDYQKGKQTAREALVRVRNKSFVSATCLVIGKALVMAGAGPIVAIPVSLTVRGTLNRAGRLQSLNRRTESYIERIKKTALYKS